MPASTRWYSKSLIVAAMLTFAACAQDSGPTAPVGQPPVPVPPRVAAIVFAQTHVSMQVGERSAVRATALDVRQLVVTGAPMTYRSADPQIARVLADGTIEAVNAGETSITASSDGVSSTLPVRVMAVVRDNALLGRWRMTSLVGVPVPATYAQSTERHHETNVVTRVDIQIDSATMELRADGRYIRRYYFTEWHNGARFLQYGWGDHGAWRQPRGELMMESNWIQNLRTDGLVLSDNRLRLNEVLWHGEATRQTVWQRIP